MKKHTKKIIPPVICILYLVIYAFLMLISIIVLNIIGLIFALIAIGGIVLSIYTLVERIEEIRNGEEDDLSKY